MTERYRLRAIGPHEFESFADVATQAFNDTEWSDEAREHELMVFEFDRSLAAFDGDAIVGTAAAYSFRLTVPGGAADAAGVTFVAVSPGHRRRGILSSLMRQQLADITARGEAIAALFASESAIYGRYGYGCATGQLRLEIRRGEGALRQDARGAGAGHGPVRLRTGRPEDVTADLVAVYDRVVPGWPGMIARDERWWRSRLFDPPSFRRGMTQLRALVAQDDRGPRGYALYRVKPDWSDDGLPCGTLIVREIVSADAAATAALWRDLLSRDLVSQVAAWQRPVDEPLLELLADRRRARPQLSDGLWVRLTDVPAALTQRSYACPADVVMQVSDDLLPDNAGRWRLSCPGPDGKASCERTTAPADLELPVAALGAAYLGGTRLGALAAAGQVTERSSGALARLSAAMYTDRAPWCPFIF
jgi:predicted acetyltransferase